MSGRRFHRSNVAVSTAFTFRKIQRTQRQVLVTGVPTPGHRVSESLEQPGDIIVGGLDRLLSWLSDPASERRNARTEYWGLDHA